MKKILILALLVFVFAHTALAQPAKWRDAEYDFKGIATALLLEPVCTDDAVAEPELRQIREAFLTGAEMKKVRLLQAQDIITLMSDAVRNQYSQLCIDDADAAQKLLLQEAQASADIAIYPTVTVYRSGTKHIPESIRAYTEYKEKTISLPHGGRQTIRYPVNRTKVIPAYDITTYTVDTTFRVEAMKTGKAVLIDTDHRYREQISDNPAILAKMFKRSVNSFFSAFYKLVK